MANKAILTSEQKEWAYRKWCEGYTKNQIASALFVSTKTIDRAFKSKVRIRPILVYKDYKKSYSRKRMTNSEKIKNMQTQELAEFLYKVIECGLAGITLCNRECDKCECAVEEHCITEIAEWLKR